MKDQIERLKSKESKLKKIKPRNDEAINRIWIILIIIGIEIYQLQNKKNENNYFLLIKGE